MRRVENRSVRLTNRWRPRLKGNTAPGRSGESQAPSIRRAKTSTPVLGFLFRRSLWTISLLLVIGIRRQLVRRVFIHSRLAFGPVQTPLHSCAEPNWWIKYGKRAASESIWYGSFSWCGKSVKFDRVCLTFVELNLGRHTVRRLNQMSRQCPPKSNLFS